MKARGILDQFYTIEQLHYNTSCVQILCFIIINFETSFTSQSSYMYTII